MDEPKANSIPTIPKTDRAPIIPSRSPSTGLPISIQKCSISPTDIINNVGQFATFLIARGRMTQSNGSTPVPIGHGLRERLLLSFVAISGFAVIAAVVGNYAFYAIGEALHEVTDNSVPPAIATLELA